MTQESGSESLDALRSQAKALIEKRGELYLAQKGDSPEYKEIEDKLISLFEEAADESTVKEARENIIEGGESISEKQALLNGALDFFE